MNYRAWRSGGGFVRWAFMTQLCGVSRLTRISLKMTFGRWLKACWRRLPDTVLLLWALGAQYTQPGTSVKGDEWREMKMGGILIVRLWMNNPADDVAILRRLWA
jgi:hypothetical protein